MRIEAQRSTLAAPTDDRHEVLIDTGSAELVGTLVIPQGVEAVVVLPHLGGAGRHRRSSRRLAAALRTRHLATCAIELLTAAEMNDASLHENRPDDLAVIAARLIDVTAWLRTWPPLWEVPVAYFAGETSAAALIAAAAQPATVRAVVSWCGRPDLAITRLPWVAAATLLLVPERDPVARERNRRAIAALLAPGWVEAVPGTASLDGDDARLDDVARRATDWFVHHAIPERYLHAS